MLFFKQTANVMIKGRIRNPQSAILLYDGTKTASLVGEAAQ
jgi:hypothetical protein